jgi:hypothetical protein
MIITIILLGTGIQSYSYGFQSIVVSNSTDVISNYTTTINETINLTNFYESLLIGIMLAVFTILQYLYFTFSHKVVKESY